MLKTVMKLQFDPITDISEYFTTDRLWADRGISGAALEVYST